MGRVGQLADEIHEAMNREHEGCSVTVEPLSSYPGLAPADGDGRAWAAPLADGSAWGAADFGTEGGLYARALSIPVVVCGPGSMRDAHRADESVALDQLEAAE